MDIQEIILQTLRNMSPAAVSDRARQGQQEKDEFATEGLRRQGYNNVEQWRDETPERYRTDLITRGLRKLGSKIPGTQGYDRKMEKKVEKQNKFIGMKPGRKVMPNFQEFEPRKPSRPLPPATRQQELIKSLKQNN